MNENDTSESKKRKNLRFSAPAARCLKMRELKLVMFINSRSTDVKISLEHAKADDAFPGEA